jgi:hypothetical protein|tara:strand:- start:191 stop:580 length:390 start_codon:yes stop_codon:yes gene_type:complete
MSEDTKTLMLTQREIDLVLECIGTNIETVKRRHPMTGSTADLIQELGEMDMDIREQAFRDDGWEVNTFTIAEDDMIQRGMDAREQAKINKVAAASRAQARRNFNMKRPNKNLSKTQIHDVWDANDPKNW